MLYSIGKDIAVMLHLARKAFFPAPLPFPLLHVDTTWKFRDMYALRDKVARRAGHRADRPQESGGRGARASTRSTMARCTPICGRPKGCKQALDRHGFDAAFGGARRDEEKSRAKERIFSLPHRQPPLGPEAPAARTVVALQCPQEPGREHARLPAVQLDRARRLAIYPARGDRDRAALFRRPRPMVERDGLILMVDDERFRAADGETAGDALGPLPHARLLSAVRRGRERGRRRVEAIVAEMLLTTTSRAAGPRDRPRRRRAPAWRRRSRRAISDGPHADDAS